MKRFSISSIMLLFVSLVAACGMEPIEEDFAHEDAALLDEDTAAELEAQGDLSPLACRLEYHAADLLTVTGGYRTRKLTTSSGCGHLRVANAWGGCVTAHIRYYPSSGGHFDSAPQQVCYNNYVYFSTNLFPGTVFRVYSNAQTVFAVDF